MHSDSVPLSFVTRSSEPEKVAEMKHEAAMLARAAQPGVIGLGAFNTSDGVTTLALTPTHGKTMADHSFTVETLAAVMTSLSMVVSRVHQRGMTHNNLNDDAVIVSARTGKPVIRNFEKATVTESRKDQEVDVRALVNLCEQHLATLPAETSGRALELRQRLEHIVATTNRSDGAGLPSARVLGQLFRRATRQSNEGRPNLRNEAVARLKVMRAKLGGDSTPTAPQEESNIGVEDEQSSSDETASHETAKQSGTQTLAEMRDSLTEHKHGLPFAAIAAFLVTTCCVLLVFGVVKFATRTQSPYIDPSLPQCVRNAGGDFAVDIDGDGCSDSVTLGDATVSVNGEKFTVGNPGDKTAIGRWSCKDSRNLALYRPSTGQVFAFDSWPARGADAVGHEVGTVSGGQTISPVAFGDCDRIGVQTAAGTTTIDPSTTGSSTSSTTTSTATPSSPVTTQIYRKRK